MNLPDDNVESASSGLAQEIPSPDRKLDLKKVVLVYTMFHHLGDFVVMGGLLRKFDLLGVDFESIVAHQNSPHVLLFPGATEGRFFNICSMSGLVGLIRTLRHKKAGGAIIFGIPMAPGSIQAFAFFWILKKLGALTYLVDFNLINADITTPPRRRYIFDRHLAQAAEILQHPEWTQDPAMPLALNSPVVTSKSPKRRIGFFPWSGRGWLPEFQWPDSHWLALANLILKETDLEIVLLGRDPGFAQLESFLRSQLPAEARNRFVAIPATSVESLVASLQELDFLITLNTSALHLAHAMKLPLVALCGSSLEIWLPEGSHVRIVGDKNGVLPPSDKYFHDPLQPSLQHVEVADVHSAFKELFQRFGGKAF